MKSTLEICFCLRSHTRGVISCKNSNMNFQTLPISGSENYCKEQHQLDIYITSFRAIARYAHKLIYEKIPWAKNVVVLYN